MQEHEGYHESVFASAVTHWWESKKKNSAGIGRSQGAGRDGNLAGDTMDGFRKTITEHLVGAGVAREDIHSGGQLDAIPANLPSYFRASKNWDVVVCKNSLFKRARGDTSGPATEPKLIAAIEFKSQQDSIGKNQNNRIEESIGNAADFWASYENKNFIHLTPRPWLGYLFVGKYEDDQVGKPVEIKQPHFPSDPAFAINGPEAIQSVVQFQGPSYAERYRIFLERMIAKKYYDGACFITSNERIATESENYQCFYPQLSGAAFIDQLLRHIRAYYPD
jgi:Restriction endonuclease XhoI